MQGRGFKEIEDAKLKEEHPRVELGKMEKEIQDLKQKRSVKFKQCILVPDSRRLVMKKKMQHYKCWEGGRAMHIKDI